MGDDRSGQQGGRQRHPHRLGRPLRQTLLRAVLDRRTGAFLRRHQQGHLADLSPGQHHRRQGRDGHAEAGFLDDPGALPPHLDDGIVQHLRHSRLRRQAQLRGLRHQRTLRRNALGRRPVQRLSSSTSPAAIRPSPGLLRSTRGTRLPTWINRRGDQIGFDFFFTCGVTRGLPTMVPIAMLYATPEDAANEIAYLYKRNYPISWIEMGEEADGQHMLPGRLRRAVPPVRHGHPQAGARGAAGRAGVRRNVRRRGCLARRQRKSLVARPLRRLPESARPPAAISRSSPSSTIPYQDRPDVLLGRSLSASRTTSTTSCKSGKTTACRRIFRSS